MTDDERLAKAILLLAGQIDAVMDVLEQDSGPDSFDRSATREALRQAMIVKDRHARSKTDRQETTP